MNDLSIEQIRYGITQLARSTDRFPPTPGLFRNLAMSWRPPLPKRVEQVSDFSAKTIAWKACQVRFATRLSGMKPADEPNTSFDVQGVIDSVYWDDNERRRAIAQGFEATRRFDQPLFDQLKRAFEGAWR